MAEKERMSPRRGSRPFVAGRDIKPRDIMTRAAFENAMGSSWPGRQHQCGIAPHRRQKMESWTWARPIAGRFPDR